MRHKVVFGNVIQDSVVSKAEKQQAQYKKKFGSDHDRPYAFKLEPNKVLGPVMGVADMVLSTEAEPLDPEKGIIVGNIRMGFGHYRISMAIASAAASMGLTPYWMDLNAYQETTGGKIISHLNGLYSLGSRLSQKYSLFNKFYWEPLNSEGFKKLSYNAQDQSVSQLMAPVFKQIPKDIPVIATHVWPAQAAVHAGMKHVVNVIPDNWPMGLHLAEGSLHTVQSYSSLLGYKTLREMAGKQVSKPMPAGSLFEVGHYIDHELVANLEADSKKRLDRIDQKKTKRILLTVGGAGAQRELFGAVITSLMPKVQSGEVTLLINVGDYWSVWEGLLADVKGLEAARVHRDDWDNTKTWVEGLIEGQPQTGIHVFCHEDIFAAVYATNLLMRAADLLVTKPSELAYYPVPKLMIKRVGGHEAWGAIRTAELGDGTIECSKTDQALQMLQLLLEEPELLRLQSDHIMKNHSIGIYDGAYKAVKLAIAMQQGEPVGYERL